uniref:DUF6760 family protein n=1 Tax=Agathobacter sp. TaxID=2021311 RepID=UPI004055F252
MSGLWKDSSGTIKFYKGGIKLYPQEELYREMSFISYYFHWSSEEVLRLDHASRRKWCSEISRINQSLNPSKKPKEKSILDMKPTR